jgi:hypothetical protein
VLYGMTGFSGLIAEQVLEKYVTLLVGATASASAVIIFTYFLGFAVGGLIAAYVLKRGVVQNPLRAYAGIELLTGCACVMFSFGFPSAMALLAPLQNLVAGEFGKYLVRFLCGCILVLPVAGLMGASFPLLAQALDDADADGHVDEPRLWSVAYSANLAGAVLASLAAPFLLLPAIGLRGAMWLCLAICAAVATFVQVRGGPVTPPRLRSSTASGILPPTDCLVLIRLCLLCARNHLDPLGRRGCGREHLRLFLDADRCAHRTLGRVMGGKPVEEPTPGQSVPVVRIRAADPALGMAARAGVVRHRSGVDRLGLLHARVVPAAGRLHPDRSLGLLAGTDLSFSA